MLRLGDLCASPELPRQLKYVLVVIEHQPVSNERGKRSRVVSAGCSLAEKVCLIFQARDVRA